MRTNPFGIRGPMKQFMDIAKQARAIQQNPGQMAQVLLKQGKIDQQTYNAVKDMSPSQMGQYLMQNGLFDEKTAQTVYHTDVPEIQKIM